MSNKQKTAAKVTAAVAVRDAKGDVPAEVQLARLEQFVRQMHAIEKRCEGDAVKAAICQGLALNFAKPMLRGTFVQWSAERFPEISPMQQHYYRKIAADFQTRMADRIALPDYRDHAGAALVVSKFNGNREAERLMDEYIGERSITEILYEIGARPQAPRGGFAPDVTQAAGFIRELRPELEGVKTADWDDDARRQFYAWCKSKESPADQSRLAYEAAKAAFDHALDKIADLINGSTPKYQRLSPKECAEVAKQLRAFADIVSKCAGPSKDKAGKARKDAKK